VRPHHHPELWEMPVLLQGLSDLLRLDTRGQISGRTERAHRVGCANFRRRLARILGGRSPTALLDVKPEAVSAIGICRLCPARKRRRVAEFRANSPGSLKVAYPR
jgi:hypothetical protein